MKYFKLRIVILLILTSLASLASADSELENENLARIQHVLNALTPLINQAEQQQDKNARIQFQYDKLRSDVNQIKQGINQKLYQPIPQSRTIKLIQGDYLSLKSKQK